MELEQLIDADPRYRKVLRAVLEHPYIERQALAEGIGVPQEELESLLRPLIESLALLELASQADSSMESRVPKKVYLVNPEFEQEFRSLV